MSCGSRTCSVHLRNVRSQTAYRLTKHILNEDVYVTTKLFCLRWFILLGTVYSHLDVGTASEFEPLVFTCTLVSPLCDYIVSYNFARFKTENFINRKARFRANRRKSKFLLTVPAGM